MHAARGQPQVVAQRVGHQRLAGPGGEQAQQGAHLGRMLDLGQLAHIASHQVGDVGVEEALAASRTVPGYRLWEPAPDDPLGVVASAETTRVPQVRPVLEYRVHEAVAATVDLTLGERPQLDRLHPTRQGVRQAAQPEHAGRAGEQVTARPGVGVDLFLDREEQLGHPLRLGEHPQRGEGHQPGRGGGRGPPGRLVGQVAPFRRAPTGDDACEGALAALPRAGDQDHPGVRQRLRHAGLGAAG